MVNYDNKLFFEFFKYDRPLKIDKPVCMLYTKGGSVPHLTQETLGYLNKHLLKKTTMYSFAVKSVIDFEDTFKAFDGDCAELFSLSHSCITCLTVQDAIEEVKKGYNTTKTVGVFAIGGKKNLTPNTYMSLVKSVRPDIYECLSDGDVCVADKRKRTIKAVTRSLQFLKDSLSIHAGSERLQKKAKMLCVISGAYNMEQLNKYLEEMKVLTEKHSNLIWGYRVDCLPVDFNELAKQTLQCVCEQVTDGKPLYVAGVGNPLSVIDYMYAGVSVFDSSYVTALANKNLAFAYKIPKLDGCGDNEKMTEGDSDSTPVKFQETIDLSDAQSYDKAFGPLVEGCECYTCVNHSCSYINHLILVNEMLAPILLTIHNLHHHLTFFKVLKEALHSGVELETIKAKLN